MTILASGPGLIVCGHTGVVNRGSRECPLPRGLGKWVGQPIEELPWPLLHQYSLWLFDQFDVFEMWAAEDETTRRLSASAHCRRRFCSLSTPLLVGRAVVEVALMTALTDRLDAIGVKCPEVEEYQRSSAATTTPWATVLVRRDDADAALSALVTIVEQQAAKLVEAAQCHTYPMPVVAVDVETDIVGVHWIEGVDHAELVSVLYGGDKPPVYESARCRLSENELWVKLADDLGAENDRLKDENERAEAKLRTRELDREGYMARIQTAERENKQLRKTLHYIAQNPEALPDALFSTWAQQCALDALELPHA